MSGNIVLELNKRNKHIKVLDTSRDNKSYLSLEYYESDKLNFTIETSNTHELVELLDRHNWRAYNQTEYNEEHYKKLLNRIEELSTKPVTIKLNCQVRILDLYLKLKKEPRSLEDLANEYQISKEQIKRDIYFIRNSLDRGALEDYVTKAEANVIYDRSEKKYKLVKSNVLTFDEATMLLTVLFNTRGLCEYEFETIYKRIIAMFDQESQQKIKKLFNSFNYHYKPTQEKAVLKTIRNVYSAILESRPLQFIHTNNKDTNKRIVIPYTLTFQNGYFYLLATKYDIESDVPKYYRLDRISDCKIIDQKNQVRKYKDTINFGEYVGCSFSMHTGEQQTVRLKVERGTEKYLMSESPKVEVVEDNYNKNYVIVDVQVLGDEGIMFWILKQQDRVEVISPEKLRNKVKETIQRMESVYK